MRTKFDIGEKVFVKGWGKDVEYDAWTVESITVASGGTTYFITDGDGSFLTAYEDQLESVVQK